MTASNLVDRTLDVNTDVRLVSRATRDACAAVPRMSDAEFRRLEACVAARRGVGRLVNQSTAPGAGGVDWILVGIEEELRARGLLGRRARLPVDVVCPKYRRLVAPATTTLREALGPAAREAEVAALGRLVGECLAYYLERRNIPVCARAMLLHSVDAVAAVDAAFPGYVGSGQIGLLIGNGGPDRN